MQNRTRSFRWFPHLIFLVAVVVRLLFISTLGERTYWIDEEYYLNESSKIHDSGGRDISTLVPPGQSVFLAGVRTIPGNPVLNGRLIQAFLSGLTVVLLFFTGRMLLGETAAVIASAAAAIYPLLIYMSGVLYPQCIFGFLLVLAVYLVVHSEDKRKFLFLPFSGAAFGLSALFVPPVAVLLPLFALWILVQNGTSLKRRISGILILAFFTLLPVVMWGTRNYVVEGRFIPIARMGGRAFYAANNPLSDPEEKNLAEWQKMFTPELMAEIKRRGGGPQAAEVVYKERAMKFITENPGRFLSLSGRRFLDFFSLYPKTFSTNLHTKKLYRIASIASFVPVLILFFAGTLTLGRLWRKAFILPLMPVLLALFYSPMGTSVRYRLPVEPYMILLGSFGLVRILSLPGRRPAAETAPGNEPLCKTPDCAKVPRENRPG